MRVLFISSGDIELDEVAKTLAVSIHRMLTPAHDKAIAALPQRLERRGVLQPRDRGENDLFTGVMRNREIRTDQNV